MPRPSSPSGLAAVAKAAGVSMMTVSRVLRKSSQVSAKTRKTVERALTKVGYQPDPQVAKLMARVREHRSRRIESLIAVVRDDMVEDELHDPAYRYVSTGDLRRRAEQHGYRLEEFFLGRGGVSASRLGQILSTRNIEGVVISPQSSRNIAAQMNYTRLAAATLGYGLQKPALHRASTNMTRGILRATEELSALGYRRIGMAVTQWVNSRSDYTYSGAMLHFQQTIPAAQRVPLLLFPKNNLSHEGNTFRTWIRKYKPDVIISFDNYVMDWITKRIGLRIPDDIGFVVHDWTDNLTGFAGIHHLRAHVAAAAVDLVATQLMHNERGIPEVPRQILIPPAWVNGATVRQKA